MSQVTDSDLHGNDFAIIVNKYWSANTKGSRAVLDHSDAVTDSLTRGVFRGDRPLCDSS